MNWSAGHIPQKPIFGEDAVINSTTGFPIILNDIDAEPQDVLVGEAGGSGRLDHRAGSLISGGGNWVHIGRGAGSIGTYNLANTAVVSGTNLTGFGIGSGSIYSSERIHIGTGDTSAVGALNINTSGIVKVPGEFNMGADGADATVKLDAGTIDVGSWFRIGWSNGGVCSINNAGGDIRQRADGNMIFADGPGTGNYTQSAGTLQVNSNDLWMGQNGGNSTVNLSGGSMFVRRGLAILGRDGATTAMTLSGTGEFRSRRDFWVGQGSNGGGPSNSTLTVNGGTIANGAWTVIGRNGGSGTVNMTGGTWIKTGNPSQFIVSADGPGTMTQSGGLVDVQGGYTWVSEGNNGTLTIKDSAEWRTDIMSVGQGGTGVLNLDGGTLRTHRLTGARERNDTGSDGGTGTINFNGTQIIATQSDDLFISDKVDNAIIGAGGLRVNSNGYDLVAREVLSGTGDVVKTGAGTLKLLAENTYAGTNTITGGGLVLFAGEFGNPTNSNPTTLANGTSLGVERSPNFPGDQAVVSSITFGTGTSLNLDSGDRNGSNPTDALLRVTGALNLAGNVAVNLKGSDFAENGVAFPMLSYTPGQLTGPGTFVAGSLPPGVVAGSFTHTPGTGTVSFTVTDYVELEWEGNQGSSWTAANNWVSPPGVSGTPASFLANSIVLFNDNAAGGAGAVQVGASVAPGSVTFDNSTIPYTLSSTAGGKITGSTGLSKTGSAALTITGMANDYTGGTSLLGGTITVDSLANGGSLGATSASTSNLVLGNGATLVYTGGAATIDRGTTLIGSATLDNASNLTLSSSLNRVTPTEGEFVKLGAGTLTLRGATNRLGDFRPRAGSVVFDPASGVQANVSSSFTVNNGASVTLANNSTTQTGDLNIGDNAGSNTLTLTGNATLENENRVLLGNNGSTGTLILSGTSQIVQSGGWLSVGQAGAGGTGNFTVKDNAKYFQSDSDFNVTDNAGTIGNVTLQDNGTIDVNNAFFGKGANTNASVTISGGTFNINNFLVVGDNESCTVGVNMSGGTLSMYGDHMYIGENADAVWTQTGGTVNINGWVVVGRGAPSDAKLNISGGSFNQTRMGRNIIVAETGKATVNVSNSGILNNSGGRIDMATANDSSAIINVTTGGTLMARGISADPNHTGVTCTLTLDNGKIVASPFAYLDFMQGIKTATIAAGGATIDSNGQSVAIAQVFGGTGNLTKIGAGAIALDGTNTFTGSTTVSAGTLGGLGTLTGSLSVSSGARLAPGHSVGTFTAGATTLSAGSTYAYEIDGATGDSLVVNGNLNITGSTLAITTLNSPSATSYVVASYTGTRTGNFASVTLNGAALPAGWSVNYGTGTNSQITLTVPATPFSTWINGFPSIPAADRDAADDPDGDSVSNLEEFALNGIPNSGFNSGLRALLLQDTVAPATKELTLVIAARDGATFAAGPNGTQVATVDGVTYTIEGSLNVVFPSSAVAKVGGASNTATAAGLPDLTGTAWEYHTFRLTASEGLTGKGFLRVKVTPAP